MKIKLIILSLIFLFSGLNTNAQLLKKLKNAVKDGIEAIDGEEKEEDVQTKEGNTGGKANTANQAATIPMGMGETIPAPADNNVKLPENYSFSYRATMRIENNKGTVEPIFYLQPGVEYYARKQVNNDMGLTEFIVLDNQLNVAVWFGEFEGKKRRTHNYVNLPTKATLIGAYRDAPEIEPVKTLESKTILGYQCQGYQITTEEGITQFWITNEAPASMFSSMLASRADKPDTPFTKNSMFMEVIFTSASAPEQNYQMECTALQPETLVLNKSDYQEAL